MIVSRGFKPGGNGIALGATAAGLPSNHECCTGPLAYWLCCRGIVLVHDDEKPIIRPELFVQ